MSTFPSRSSSPGTGMSPAPPKDEVESRSMYWILQCHHTGWSDEDRNIGLTIAVVVAGHGDVAGTAPNRGEPCLRGGSRDMPCTRRWAKHDDIRDAVAIVVARRRDVAQAAPRRAQPSVSLSEPYTRYRSMGEIPRRRPCHRHRNRPEPARPPGPPTYTLPHPLCSTSLCTRRQSMAGRRQGPSAHRRHNRSSPVRRLHRRIRKNPLLPHTTCLSKDEKQRYRSCGRR